MLSISNIRAPILSLWRQLPVGTVPVLLTATVGIFINRTVSDRRLCAVVHAITFGTLLLLSNKVQRLFHRFEELRERPPQPRMPLVKDPTSYLNLLPETLLNKTGTYLDYATQQVFESEPLTDTALDQLKKGLKVDPERSDESVRQVLSDLRLEFCPYFDESALDNLRRYQTVIAPESRLLQKTPLLLQAKRLPINSTFCKTVGPLLITKNEKGIVAYHWPTGAIKWIQPDRSLDCNLLDFRTGQPIATQPLYVNASLEHVEIREPRKLFYHYGSVQKEMLLEHDCTEILAFQYPYLCFSNAEGIWVKNGDAPEFLTEAANESEILFRLSMQAPYLFATKGSVGFTMGVYSLKDGKEILTIPELARGISIQQKTNPLSDIKDSQTAHFFPHQNWKQGALLIDLHAHPLKLGIYYPQRHHALHPIDGLAGAIILNAYNNFILLGSGRRLDYFVIDLAEQSLVALPADQKK